MMMLDASWWLSLNLCLSNAWKQVHFNCVRTGFSCVTHVHMQNMNSRGFLNHLEHCESLNKRIKRNKIIGFVASFVKSTASTTTTSTCDAFTKISRFCFHISAFFHKLVVNSGDIWNIHTFTTGKHLHCRQRTLWKVFCHLMNGLRRLLPAVWSGEWSEVNIGYETPEWLRIDTCTRVSLYEVWRGKELFLESWHQRVSNGCRVLTR